MRNNLSGYLRSTSKWRHIGIGVLALFGLTQTHLYSAWGESSTLSDSISPSSFLEQPVPPLDGALTIVADSSLGPHLTSIGNGFRRHNPSLTVVVQETSSAVPGLAIDAFLKDFAQVRRGNGFTKGPSGSTRVKLLALPRNLTASEIDDCISRFGYRPLSIAFGKGAVALYVNRANPVSGLSIEQVLGLFSGSSEENGKRVIAEWGRVGGESNWTNFPVHLYGVNRGQRIIRNLFHQLVLGDVDKEWDTSLTELSGPASLALAIGNDTFGIGFGPLGYTMPQIRAIPIAKKTGMPVIEPTPRTVMNGTYPLSQPLSLHINKAPNEKLSPVLVEFLKYLHSQEGQALLAANGAFPLQEFEVARNLQVLELSGASLAASR